MSGFGLLKPHRQSFDRRQKNVLIKILDNWELNFLLRVRRGGVVVKRAFQQPSERVYLGMYVANNMSLCV